MSGPHQIIWSCVISLHDVNQWRNVCSRMLGSDTTIRFFCLIYICFLNGTPWEVPCSNAHELIHPELKTSSDFRFCTWFLHDINARKIAQFSGHRLPIQAVVFPSFDSCRGYCCCCSWCSWCCVLGLVPGQGGRKNSINFLLESLMFIFCYFHFCLKL